MRYSIVLGLCLLVTCSDQPLPSWETRIDAFISSELTAKEIPALSITIVDGDQIAWTKGYGKAASEMPATSQTVYRVASVSKLFTALAVMQLVEDSLLSLDEPITSWLPDFAPNNPYDAPITLRQLLSHRSGLVREPPVGHYFDDTSPTLFETVRSLNNSRLISEPGKRTKYSNAAVSLAGYILSQAADMPFNEFVQTRLIDPMGLERTSFVSREDLRNNLGVGYMWRYDTTELTKAPVFELGIGPAGNLYTTTEDLGKFIHTLFAIERDERPDLLRAKSLQEMWTVQFSDNPSGFGIGFHVSDHNGLLRIGHAGMIYAQVCKFSRALTDLLR
ncbi:MAG: serine hydrolase [Bacteroidetes bacterium]|nr:serine hydrolase [Bacteroidota bacterium]